MPKRSHSPAHPRHSTSATKVAKKRKPSRLSYEYQLRKHQRTGSPSSTAPSNVASTAKAVKPEASSSKPPLFGLSSKYRRPKSLDKTLPHLVDYHRSVLGTDPTLLDSKQSGKFPLTYSFFILSATTSHSHSQASQTGSCHFQLGRACTRRVLESPQSTTPLLRKHVQTHAFTLSSRMASFLLKISNVCLKQLIHWWNTSTPLERRLPTMTFAGFATSTRTGLLSATSARKSRKQCWLVSITTISMYPFL